jgi:hypothetical protein
LLWSRTREAFPQSEISDRVLSIALEAPEIQQSRGVEPPSIRLRIEEFPRYFRW